MYEGYQKIARGYRKCLEGIKCWKGIENVRRVSENLKTNLLSFNRVSKISGGHRKYYKGIGN